MHNDYRRVAARLVREIPADTTITQKSVREVLRDADLVQARAQDVLALVNQWHELRGQANRLRIARRLGHVPDRPIPSRSITSPNTRTIPLAQRLERRRLRAIKDHYHRTIRTGQHDELRIRWASDAADVGVAQQARTDWGVYRGSYRGWACKYWITTLTMPRQWISRVERHGLAVLGGMLTLDAEPVAGAPAGVDLYAAVWISNGRGNTINVHRGHIAHDGLLEHHATTAAQALAGLARKQRAASTETVGPGVAELPRYVQRHPDLVVTLDDARQIGACNSGIRAWCEQVGINYAAGQAPLLEVYRAFRLAPMAEARAAMLHAIRRAGV